MGRGSGGNVGRTPQQQSSTQKTAVTNRNTSTNSSKGANNNNHSENDLLQNTSITMTRAKRTPKPNRKYINDELITMQTKIASSSRSNSPDTEDIDDDDDADVILGKKGSGKGASVAARNSDDEITIAPRNNRSANLRKKPVAATVKTVSITKAPIHHTSTPVAAANRKIYEMRDLTVRHNRETTTNTPVHGNRRNVQQLETMNSRTAEKKTPVLPPRKRVQKNDDIDFEMPTSNEEDDADDDDFEEEKSPRVVRRTRQVIYNNNTSSANSSSNKMSQQPVRHQITRVTTSTTIGSTSITPTTVSRNITSTGATMIAARNKLNNSNSTATNAIIKKNLTQTTIAPRFKLTESTTQNTNSNKPNSVHSFTIVNINDIIKKGPADQTPLKKRKLIESNTTDVLDSKRKRFAEALENSKEKRNNSNVNKNNNNNNTTDLDDELMDDDDVELIEVKENKHDSGLNNRNNNGSRRKTQHTTILTDDFEAKIKTNQLHKSTLVQQSLNNNGKFKENDKKTTVRGAGGAESNQTGPQQNNNKNVATKPPPRILNSMLGRRTNVKQSELVGEFDIKQSKLSASPVIEMKPSGGTGSAGGPLSQSSATSKTSSQNINNNSNLTKDNIMKTYKSNNSNLVNAKTKLESLMDSKPKVVYEEQDGKRVKKITCFETWYVINIPNIDVPVQKPSVNVTLMRIGNAAKKIRLPSSQWTYRITLTKLKMEKHDEVYTGEVQDDHIKESERHLYEPTNIMFRRRNSHISLNMQYDRAIIFKNASYFLNIDGKSVKLLGSPHSINSLAEVETLLQIVDDISLVNSCVEPTQYGS